MKKFQRLASTILVVAASLLASVPSFAQTIVKIGSSEDLTAALSSPKGDTVYELASGDYGKLALKAVGGAEGAPLVLRSADPAAPARFSGMDLREVSHLRLEGLLFDYSFDDAEALSFRPFQIVGAKDITLVRNVFDGDLAQGMSNTDDGYPTGVGFALTSVQGGVLEGNEIRDFFRGLVVARSSDLTIRGNDLHAIRMDGMNFAEVQNVVIEDNVIRDFKRVLPSSDHSDMIQFWTARTEEPSTDITIRNNLLNSGGGHYTQSIFMRNELVDTNKAGREMFYRNVLIEENVIINAHLHGISIGEIDGLVIRNNSVLRNARSEGKQINPGLWTPQIRVAPTSTNVVIERNVTSQVSGYSNQADWQVSSNFLVQDRFPGRPGFYDQVFVAARTGDPRDLESFAALSGGPLDGAGLGAARLAGAKSHLAQGEQMRPVARILEDPDYRNRFRFEATTSGLPEGVAPDEVVYDWDLGDGTRATGVAVSHDYGLLGPIKVMLTATLPDGRKMEVENAIHIQGPTVLTFSTETGDFVSYAERDPMIIPDLELGRGPAVLGQGVAPIVLRAAQIKPFFNSSDFELAMRVRGVANSRSAGELLRIHTNFLVTVTQRGLMEVRLNTEGAEALHVKTSALPLFSGEWVDLVFAYSASRQLFTVTANGRVIGQGRTFGQIREMEQWGLSLGNPFGNRKSFDGELGGLTLKANQETYLPVASRAD